MKLIQAYKVTIQSREMTDFHQHSWLNQPARMDRGSTPNTAAMSSAVQDVAESYTTESSSHK